MIYLGQKNTQYKTEYFVFIYMYLQGLTFN